MSAEWTCDVCGRHAYDDPPWKRRCKCVTVRHEDWLLLRELWKNTRQRSVGDDPFWPNDEMNARLDALFFAGEECRAETAPASAAVHSRGEDSCD